MAEPFDDLIGLTNPRSTYNPTGGVVQLPGQGGAPGPYTVDPGAAMSSYLEAFSPELMNRILELERSYAPQFSELDIAARNRNLASFTDLIGTLTNTAGDVARGEARTQSQAEIDRMAQFGGPTIAAYIAANPYLQSAMSRSDALGGVSTNAAYDALSRSLLGGAPSAINLTAQQVTPGTLASGGTLTPQQVTADQLASMGTLTPQQVSAMMMGPMAAISPERVSANLIGSVAQLTPERVAAERIAAGQVQAGEVGAGALGQSLYQQALQNQQMSPLSQALQARGLGMAQMPGQITAEEARAATQGARERFASAGRLEDISAITGEALARAGASRERQMQDLAAAQQINAQLLGAQQAGQSLATDVLRADIARQQANVATGLQASTFNVDAAMRAALANQQTGLQSALANQQAMLDAGKFNIGNELAIAQANAAAQNQFALANQQAGLSAAELNARNQLAVQQANQAAANQFALANQQAGMQAGQFNISNATELARLNQAANLQANLANQQAGMQAGQFNIQNLQDIGRFNIGNQLQSGMFNAEAANRMAEANRGFNYTAQQDYLRNLGLLGQSTQGLREADRAYNLNQVGAYGGVSRAGLDAAGYNQPPPGVAGAMNYFTLGSNVTPTRTFDPNAGINLAATNAANLSNYGANIYSANQAAAAANRTASATRSAGNVTAGATIGAALIAL